MEDGATNAAKSLTVKRISSGVLACAIAVLVPQSGSPQDATSPMHMIPAKDVSLTADSIVRRDQPNASNVARYASDIELKGHVEVKVCCVQRELRQKPPEQMIIVNADEVDYHADTLNFEAHGTVKVIFRDKQ
jgi:hypothetical protein